MMRASKQNFRVIIENVRKTAV